MKYVFGIVGGIMFAGFVVSWFAPLPASKTIVLLGEVRNVEETKDKTEIIVHFDSRNVYLTNLNDENLRIPYGEKYYILTEPTSNTQFLYWGDGSGGYKIVR